MFRISNHLETITIPQVVMHRHVPQKIAKKLKNYYLDHQLFQLANVHQFAMLRYINVINVQYVLHVPLMVHQAYVVILDCIISTIGLNIQFLDGFVPKIVVSYRYMDLQKYQHMQNDTIMVIYQLQMHRYIFVVLLLYHYYCCCL